MSAELNTSALMAARPTGDLDRFRTRALFILVVGVGASAFGFFGDRGLFLQSYLIAYMFWLGISLGSLALLMVQYLSGGRWGLFVRRFLEAATRTLPLMAVLFIPIYLNLQTLYPWARPDAINDPEIQKKAAYLNIQFFTIRAILYFVIWNTLAFFLNRWSKEQDGSQPLLPGPKDSRLRVLSGPGIVLYMLTMTFMSVDWVMSLQPAWFSTIFGILTLGGQGLSTLSFVTLATVAFAKSKPVSEFAEPDRYNELGNLMLAFVMLWAYFNVSQLIIIWSANLPEEIPWYIDRLLGTWQPIAILVLLGHFALPLFILLMRDIKRHRFLLSRVAIFVLIMRVVDLTWTIGPVFRKTSTVHWLDFAVVLAMGGLWLLMFTWTLGGRAMVPAHDPYFKEAMAHGGH